MSEFIAEEVNTIRGSAVDLILDNIQAYDTASDISLYREVYVPEELVKGNDNFETFTEWRERMNK